MGKTIAALLLTALLAGCATVGREFPVEPVRHIVIGHTTRDDIRTLFGEPWRTGLEDGSPTWTYGHYRYAAFGETRTRDLIVRFDAKGKVSSYTFNSSFPEDRVD